MFVDVNRCKNRKAIEFLVFDHWSHEADQAPGDRRPGSPSRLLRGQEVYIVRERTMARGLQMVSSTGIVEVRRIQNGSG